MSQLVWDAPGDRRYETGLDRGVLFLPGMNGIPWNGLTEVNDTPDGGETTSYWLDGVKYLDSIGAEDYKASVSAFTYPDEFEPYQGVGVVQQGLFATAQPRNQCFSFSYRTKVGNDVDGEDFAYRIHIIMNVKVAPLARDHKTQAAGADLETFKWDLVAVPIYIPGMRPTAHLIIDSRATDPQTMQSIEAVLYGTNDIVSHLPSIDNLINLLVQDGTISITDNGDGTWTAIGPNEFFSMLDDKTFQITNANVAYLDPDTYTIQDTETP
jgi:hypothetical protein